VKIDNFFMAVILTTALGACSTTTDVSIDKGSVNNITKTETGWLSSIPMSNLYDYQLIDVRTDKPLLVDLTQDDGGLLEYDIVFIGENHRHPGNHLAQAMIYQRLLHGGQQVILSMEQFERDTQQTVDAYLAGEIGEWALRHFGRAWDNYPSSYRPLVEMAKERGLPVIAANAPKDTVICTGRNGLDVLEMLPASRKGEVAASFHTPESGAYFEKFAGFIRHGDRAKLTKDSLNRYHAQVVRDDTMAESIDKALQAHPEHKLVHLNGHFHSASSLGTVERVKLRRDRKIAVIQPVMVNNPKKPSFNDKDLATGDYLLLIHPLAEQVKTEENRAVWRKTVFKRSKQDCTFGREKT